MEGFPLTKIRPFSRYSAQLRRAAASLVAVAVMATNLPVAKAQEFATGTILSDTEIEATLQAYARPLLAASGMPPDRVQIHMMVDDSINAFATNGSQMYFNTGLILKAENSNEVIGVMAHELGHIAGGHVITAADGAAAPNAISLLATLLGVAAGVAAGSPDLGIALMMGGQRAAIGEYLSFSRGVESRADQFALDALAKSNQSAEGLYAFFNRLAGEELLITDRGDPYVRTHPMSRDRMATIRAAIDRSNAKQKPNAPSLDTQLAKPGDTIAIGSDAAGLELKSIVSAELTRMGYKVKDTGSAAADAGQPVNKAVDTHEAKAGVVVNASTAMPTQGGTNVLTLRARAMQPDQVRTQIEDFLKRPSQADTPPSNLEEQHKRMVAKLYAFLKPQYATLARYPESDKSVWGRYARAIAYYRRGQFDKSLPIVDDLLQDRPQDPFFWQIKGDMQLSRSKTSDAVVAYREALKYMPNAPEILNAKAHAMIESGDASYAAEAEETLKRSTALDPENAYTWDLMARSYSLADNQGMSAYAAAEKAMLIGQFGDVARYSMQADKLLEKGTPTWYRLQDIKIAAQNYMREQKERRR